MIVFSYLRRGMMIQDHFKLQIEATGLVGGGIESQRNLKIS